MNARATILFALTLLFLLSAPAVSSRAENRGVTAFVDVSLVSMEGDRAAPHQTVVVAEGRIVSVGPAGETPVPAGATIVDGGGAYLAPGLADMHAHLWFDPRPEFMRLFLAEGVTTIRNLNGLPGHLQWKKETASGARIGPAIYTSGKVIVGPPDAIMVWMFRGIVVALFLALGLAVGVIFALAGPKRQGGLRGGIKKIFKVAGLFVVVALGVIGAKLIPFDLFLSQEYPFAFSPDTVERAEEEVRRQKGAGYDFVKVYDFLPEEIYLAVINAARKEGIYVIGHLDHGIEAPLKAGLNEVAHVDEFMEAHFLEEITPMNFKPVPLDLATIGRTIGLAAGHDVMVVSNMVTDVITYEYLEAGPSYFDRPEYAVIRPQTVEAWRKSRMVRWQGQQEWRRRTVHPFLEEMVRGLHKAGVLILAGTDTGVEGGLPSHIHRELELLVQAGLSPYEALTTATVNPAISVRRMGGEGEFGQIKPGYRADLILLADNPLENISATRKRIGVMSRGVWRTQKELDSLCDDLRVHDQNQS